MGIKWSDIHAVKCAWHEWMQTRLSDDAVVGVCWLTYQRASKEVTLDFWVLRDLVERAICGTKEHRSKRKTYQREAGFIDYLCGWPISSCHLRLLYGRAHLLKVVVAMKRLYLLTTEWWCGTRHQCDYANGRDCVTSCCHSSDWQLLLLLLLAWKCGFIWYIIYFGYIFIS